MELVRRLDTVIEGIGKDEIEGTEMKGRKKKMKGQVEWENTVRMCRE
jgi:hypothetical protein